MLNDRFANLPEYMFPRYRALIADTAPAANLGPINMTFGEPRHKVPAFVGDILKAREADFGKYPPIQGTEEWQEAVTGWLTRRYKLTPGMVSADNILPLAGTREGLFLAALAVTPTRKCGHKPAVVMPNPFYQCYLAAALAAHADPILLDATARYRLPAGFRGAAGRGSRPRVGAVPVLAGQSPGLGRRHDLSHRDHRAGPRGRCGAVHGRVLFRDLRVRGSAGRARGLRRRFPTISAIPSPMS